jgi:hypothetical protein
MAQLHLLTEELDRQMAIAWANAVACAPETDAVERYRACWLAVGRQDDRNRQLEMVLSLGTDMDRLTRAPGLRMMLRMMRRPAHAAGLGSLQMFLESGFDTFAQMSGKGARAREFLKMIEERESVWIKGLSDREDRSAEAQLRACVAHARRVSI